jgi:ferredoxin
MKVWIDQDLCTGDGLCEEIAPAVFTLLDDGLAYVKEGDDVKSEPGGAAGVAIVAEGLEDAVAEAAECAPASASSSSHNYELPATRPSCEGTTPGRC